MRLRKITAIAGDAAVLRSTLATAERWPSVPSQGGGHRRGMLSVSRPPFRGTS